MGFCSFVGALYIALLCQQISRRRTAYLRQVQIRVSGHASALYVGMRRCAASEIWIAPLLQAHVGARAKFDQYLVRGPLHFVAILKLDGGLQRTVVRDASSKYRGAIGKNTAVPTSRENDNNSTVWVAVREPLRRCAYLSGPPENRVLRA